MIYKFGDKVAVISEDRTFKWEGEVVGITSSDGKINKLIVKDSIGTYPNEHYAYDTLLVQLSRYSVHRLDGIATGRGADDYITEFISTGNNMNDMSGKEFLSKFQDFCKEHGVEMSDLVEWAEDFQSFVNDNTSYQVCPESALLLNTYLVY